MKALDANQFEIALYALCDYLLEPDAPHVEKTEISKIEELHRHLEVQDAVQQRIESKT